MSRPDSGACVVSTSARATDDALKRSCVKDSAMALMRFFASTAAALGLNIARGAP